MTITVNWPAGVINIPRDDLLLVQSTPIEIRELNLEDFRLALKNLEDDEEGIAWPYTHNHNPPVNVGGVALAQVIQITDDYTITFQDGAYVVNVVGGNSNLVDRLNPNNVSVRTANSAGLAQQREIQTAAFSGAVTLNTVTGVVGTAYPTGTDSRPSNNLSDAQLIAGVRSFARLRVEGDLTAGATDTLANWTVEGVGDTLSRTKTRLIMVAGCNTQGMVCFDLRLEGEFGGEIEAHDCIVGEVTNSHCAFVRCGMVGPMTVPAGATSSHVKEVSHCYSGKDPFVLDQNGSAMKYRFTQYNGDITLRNGTHASSVIYLNMAGGVVTLESSCTGSTYIISGNAVVVDQS